MHGADEVDRAELAARALFGEAISTLDEATLLDVVADAPSHEVSRTALTEGLGLIDALVESGLASSKGEARRVIAGGGAYVNNRKVADDQRTLGDEDLLHRRYVVLRKGKRDHHLLVVVELLSRLGGPGLARRGPRQANRLFVWLAAVAVVVLGIGAFVAYGVASPGGTDRQRTANWVSATMLGQSIGTLTGDNARITTVEARHNGTKALHADCAVLLNDAEAANGNLPSPDLTLTDLLSKAYGLEGDAANDCYNAGATNPPLLATSAAKRAQAEALFERALGRVRTLTGTTPATTTTTEPDAGGLLG